MLEETIRLGDEATAAELLARESRPSLSNVRDASFGSHFASSSCRCARRARTHHDDVERLSQRRRPQPSCAPLTSHSRAALGAIGKNLAFFPPEIAIGVPASGRFSYRPARRFVHSV